MLSCSNKLKNSILKPGLFPLHPDKMFIISNREMFSFLFSFFRRLPATHCSAGQVTSFQKTSHLFYMKYYMKNIEKITFSSWPPCRFHPSHRWGLSPCCDAASFCWKSWPSARSGQGEGPGKQRRARSTPVHIVMHPRGRPHCRSVYWFCVHVQADDVYWCHMAYR